MLRPLLVCGIGLLAIAGCAHQRRRLQEEIAPTHEQLLGEGQRTYERACSSCHGLDGRGDGPVASSLKIRPTNLTLLAKRNGAAYAILNREVTEHEPYADLALHGETIHQ